MFEKEKEELSRPAKRRPVGLIIRGGMVVDGSGGEPRRADIAVAGNTIVQVGDLGRGENDSPTLDASGQVVSPGFIDLHSHSDHLLLLNPLAESKLLQGVTLEVGGNCGLSAAPVEAEGRAAMTEELAPAGLEVDWQTTGEFLGRVERSGLAINFATLAGHGNLRGIVVGQGDTPARPEQVAQMRREAGRALKEGAFGLSAGLIYPPGCYADVEELAGVCAAVGGKGFFSLHLRDEGAGLLVALEEALEIARRSQTALQVSHFKASGQANWHLQIKGREKLEQARDEGMDITADIYPYEATNTVLSAVLPDWMKAGGRLALLARLQDAAALENLSQEWGERARDPAVWKEYAICHTFASENGEFEGRRISEICQQRRRTPLEVITRLLLTDVGRTEIMRFCLSVENLEETLRRPWVMIGSDASAKDFSGDWGHPHPRGFGTFPRIIAEFVRKRQILSLPEAVRKMTFLPAQRLGLADRGRIVPGCKADLVIFNAETIADEATYARPLQAPRGISWVIVNGVVAAQAGQPTGARPGKVLRRTE